MLQKFNFLISPFLCFCGSANHLVHSWEISPLHFMDLCCFKFSLKGGYTGIIIWANSLADLQGR